MGICDKEVFEKIYLGFNKPLQIFLQARGLDRDAAADKVQESFLKLWKNCAKVSFEKSKSYLFTIASNLQIDEYRKSKLGLQYKQQLSEPISFNDGQYQMELSEFKEKLESAIDGMTEGSRAVFMLSRFQDMKYKEIAETLEISVKAVEKRMSKALAHLYEQKIFKK